MSESGLPDLPSHLDVEGTRSEIEVVERQFNSKWKGPKDGMAGLTDRHRGALRSYLIRLNAYALKIGITHDDLEYLVHAAIKKVDQESRPE